MGRFNLHNFSSTILWYNTPRLVKREKKGKKRKKRNAKEEERKEIKKKRRKRRKAMESILSYPGRFPVSVIINYPPNRSRLRPTATEAYVLRLSGRNKKGRVRRGKKLKSALLHRLERLEARGLCMRENILWYQGKIRCPPEISWIGVNSTELKLPRDW